MGGIPRKQRPAAAGHADGDRVSDELFTEAEVGFPHEPEGTPVCVFYNIIGRVLCKVTPAMPTWELCPEILRCNYLESSPPGVPNHANQAIAGSGE